MSTSAYFNKEAQDALVKGLNLVSQAVGSTLGPAGSTVVFQEKDKPVVITKDGVTVAKQINPKDEKVKLGAELAINISKKQLDSVGDGCQPFWEKIITPNGYVTFEEVREGDVILGSDGKPQRVLKVYDKGEKELLKLNFTNGESVVCSPDHMWTLYDNKTMRYENKKVEELYKDLKIQHSTKENEYRWSLPKKPVSEFNESEVVLDPFVLGAYLGNGHIVFDETKPNSPKVCFRLGRTENEKKILSYILDTYPLEDIEFYEESSISIRITIGKDSGRDLFGKLCELGLFGKHCKEKFIPKCYLYNGVEVRKRLLDGLLFTDGHKKKEEIWGYTTASDELADDVKFLAQSLGYNVYSEKPMCESFEHSKCVCNDLVIYENIVSKLVSIEHLGYSEPVRCIKVSNDDELYLTSNFLVTHNTTTACVLGNAIVNTGIRQIELSDSKVNRTAVRHGIEKARDYLVKKIVSLGKAVEGTDDLINVATISANGDEKLGKVVAEAYEKVGKDGIVQVEETKDRDIRLEFKEGMTFSKGWTSQFFVNNPEDQTVEYENPRILLCESKITNFRTLIDVIQNISSTGTPVVVIAESFDSSVTQGLAMNIIRTAGQLKVACVEAPGYGDRRLDLLRDMAVYLGGCVADDPMGKKFELMSPIDLGSCEKIIIKKDETIIRGGLGDPEQVKARVATLQGVIDNMKENDSFEKEQISKRIAALTTGVAVIKVGGSSEEEIKELKDRLDDAQWAVKSALQTGFLPGGGTTLLRLSETIQDNVQTSSDDERLGVEIVSRALKAPFRVILENAGVDPESTIKKVLETNDMNVGYDARNLEIKDMLLAGIIDPVKVVTGSIYAATSIASVVLTSNVIITTDKEENNGPSLNLMPGGMM